MRELRQEDISAVSGGSVELQWALHDFLDRVLRDDISHMPTPIAPLDVTAL